jgi:hypothetical protein
MVPIATACLSDRCSRRVHGGRERAHQLVADVLDDRPLMPGGRVAEDFKRLRDDRLRAGIAKGFIDLGAAADVDKQDGQKYTRMVLGIAQCMPGQSGQICV